MFASKAQLPKLHFQGLRQMTCLLAAEQGAQSAWDEWVRETLVSALEAAPMDLHDAWAVAVRYAVHWLSCSEQPFLKLLLPAALQMPPSGRSPCAHCYFCQYLHYMTMPHLTCQQVLSKSLNDVTLHCSLAGYREHVLARHPHLLKNSWIESDTKP